MADMEFDSAPHSSDDSNASFGLSAKRRLIYSQRPHPPEVKVVKRIQKNARERQRVAQVRNQYNVLRRTLGDDFRTQKVNKVKTLHGAIEYIKGLTNEFEHLRSAGQTGVKVGSRLRLEGKAPESLSHYLCNSHPQIPKFMPTLSCEETLEKAGEEVPNDDDAGELGYLNATPPGEACLPTEALFFHPVVPESSATPTGVTREGLRLPTPRGSPTMTAFGNFSPTEQPFASPGPPGPEIAELFQPNSSMSDIIYEVGHNPWTLSPPPSLYHYPAIHYEY
eukprot:Em0001g3610a